MDTDESNKDYEIAFLLKDEADLRALLGVIRQHEAVITFESPLKKIALAYEIEGHTSALFGFIRFTASPSRATELSKVLTLHQSVIRFLIVKYVPGQTPVSVSAPAVSEAVESVVPVSQPTESSGHSLPLSNADLEKKIEEILK